MELNQELNSDMVFEILSHSSLKTLAKCRLLSKEYNQLSYDSAFTDLHSQRTQTKSGFFMQTKIYDKTSACFISIINNSNSNISLDFLPSSSTTIAASSLQGILFCIGRIGTRSLPRYYVCKPATKEWRPIPNPKTRYSTESIGIKALKSNPLHYKIVRFSRPKMVQYVHYFYRCEIFYSMRGNWRQIEQVKLPYDGTLSGQDPAISACGKLHWPVQDKVIAFDVDDEKYCLFSPPSPVYDNSHYNKVHLTNYNGKLALVCKKEGYFELWVMENYQQKEWTKRPTVKTDSKGLGPPVAFCNSDIALIPGFHNFLFFKFKNGNTIDEVEFDDSNTTPPEAFPFRTDFEPCNLKKEIMYNQ